MIASVGQFSRGRMLSVRGDHAHGIATMRSALDSYRAIGQRIALPLMLALLADSYAAAGDGQEAFACLTEARETAESSGEIRFLAEIHRIEGDRHLGADDPVMAEQCYRKAVELARAQGAVTLELRATTSLAALATRPNTPVAVRLARREELASLVDSFREGLDTADARDANRVLAELTERGA